jgi:hypothetical protein
LQGGKVPQPVPECDEQHRFILSSSLDSRIRAQPTAEKGDSFTAILRPRSRHGSGMTPPGVIRARQSKEKPHRRA